MSYEYKVSNRTGKLFRHLKERVEFYSLEGRWEYAGTFGDSWDKEFTPLKVVIPDYVAVPPATTTPPSLAGNPKSLNRYRREWGEFHSAVHFAPGVGGMLIELQGIFGNASHQQSGL